jgi:hypothetical protein
LEELKLFLVTFRGPDPCFRLQVAKNAEEAFLCCFDKHTGVTAREGRDRASCKVEEAKVEGYEIILKPSPGKQ